MIELTTGELASLANPYKGLRAFGEADAEHFFGRDTLIQELLAQLSTQTELDRFLAIVGPSGSGKSSVAKAGLVPALRRGGLPGSENWFILDLIPGAHPWEEIETALLRVAVNPPETLLNQLQDGDRGLLRAVNRVLPHDEETELVLLIDQFEEIFTLVEEEAVREQFLNSLVTAVLDESSRLRIVITMRADFYDRPLQYVDFGDLLRQQSVSVLPMTPDELEQAISRPVLGMGVSLEPGLAAAIIRDVGDQPGTLPLLQYILTELFDRRDKNVMTSAAYEAVGGVSGALSRRADELYGGLDDVGRAAARQLFLRLVTLGEGVEDTRRRVHLSELAEMIVGGQESQPFPESRLDEAIDAYGRYRLLTFDHDPITREPTVEVAHEALLNEWGRLRVWLADSREDVRRQRLLANAARQWTDAGRDTSYLLRGNRLAHFEGWRGSSSIALTADEADFLAESVAAEEARLAAREARRQRELETARHLAETEKARAEEQEGAASRLRQRAFMLAGVMLVAVILAVAAALFGRDASRNAELATTREAEAVVAAQAEATAAANALELKAIAEQAQAAAEAQTLLIQSRELVAASTNALENDPELALLLAFWALATTNTDEAEQALHTALISSRVRQRLAGHRRPIERLAYSPDGSLIALGAYEEKLATIWEASSGQKQHEIPVARCCFGLYFDDDGQRLAAVKPGDEFSLAIWDTVSGEQIELFILPLAATDIGGYYLNPDWTEAALYFSDGAAAVWDLRAAEARYDLPGYSGEYVELEYTIDGSRLVTYDDDGLVLVWDAASGELLRRIETGWPISDHAVSPDGNLVALGTLANDRFEVHVWELDDPGDGEEIAPIARMTGHNQEILVLAFSPDGRLLASASRDGTARVWDISGGRELLVLPHPTRVRSVIFHPDGESLLTSDVAGVARVWDITAHGEEEKLTLAAHADNVFSAAMSPDERRLATTSWDGTARIWELEKGKMVELRHDPEETVTSVAYHPDGRRVATAGTGGAVRVWDADTGAELLRLDGHGEGIIGGFFPGVLGVVYSPDGKRLVSVGADKTIRFWDSESGEALSFIEGHSVGIASLAFSPDGRYLATGGGDIADASIRIWDADTGQEQIVIPPSHFDRVWGLDFSPDGRLLASSGGDTTTKIWALNYDAGVAALMATLAGHTNTVLRTRFSPDGRRLATASPLEVRLWDLAELYTGAEAASVSELLVLPGGPALVFGRGGAELITAGDDRLLRVYLLDRDELLALAESRLTRPLTDEECRRYLYVDTCPEAP